MSYGFKSHDVRKLRRCSICEGIGHKDRMLTLPGWPVEQLFHGDCAVRMLSRSEVLALPWSEQKKLTIEDTGMDLMKELLKVLDSRPAGAAAADSCGVTS